MHKNLHNNAAEFFPPKYWEIRGIENPHNYVILHKIECSYFLNLLLEECKGVLLEEYPKWGVGWVEIFCVPIYEMGELTDIFKKISGPSLEDIT